MGVRGAVFLGLTLSILPGVLGGALVVMYPVSHICALRGSSVLIPCTYDYPDIATVTERKWMKDIGSNWNAPPFIYQSNGESLDPDYTGRVQYTEQDKSCSFMLTGLRNNDSGSYYFQIKINMHPNAYTGVPGVCLSVADQPLKVTVTSTGSDEIFLGDNVTLTCSTESCSPNQTEFTWFKDGQPTYNTTSNTLSFNPVSYGDSANYSCASKDNTSVQSPQITLDVKYAPKDTSVSVSPSGEIVEGSSVTLTCSSNANPPVQNYTWFKTNGAAVWERKSQKDLIIAEISSGDSGQYYCEAQNEIGAQKSTAVSLVVAAHCSVLVIVALSVSLAVLLTASLAVIVYLSRRISSQPTPHSGNRRVNAESEPSAPGSDPYMSLDVRTVSQDYASLRRNKGPAGDDGTVPHRPSKPSDY